MKLAEHGSRAQLSSMPSNTTQTILQFTSTLTGTIVSSPKDSLEDLVSSPLSGHFCVVSRCGKFDLLGMQIASIMSCGLWTLLPATSGRDSKTTPRSTRMKLAGKPLIILDLALIDSIDLIKLGITIGSCTPGLIVLSGGTPTSNAPRIEWPSYVP